MIRPLVCRPPGIWVCVGERVRVSAPPPKRVLVDMTYYNRCGEICQRDYNQRILGGSKLQECNIFFNLPSGPERVDNLQCDML